MTTKRLSGLAITMLLCGTGSIDAANYEWNFNNSNLSDAFSNGTMAPTGTTVTSILTTDGVTIPHIGGVPAKVLSVPVMNDIADGYNLTLAATGPNGGGAYVNQYSIVMDILSPGAQNWTALFNTNPANTNDADWYVAPDGSLGIAALGYSTTGLVQANTWCRIGFTADLGAGTFSYYVNGAQVYNTTIAGQLDGRFSLYSNLDAGDDVKLFNEGDTSGNYTHALYVNSVAVVDRQLSASEMSALGGPSAQGILVPEPGSILLGALGLAGLAGKRRRARLG